MGISGGEWYILASLPTRGAWIEMAKHHAKRNPCQSRSPHGERGLKSLCLPLLPLRLSRSPHGERGLKLPNVAIFGKMLLSLPTRGAWIEIKAASQTFCTQEVAPHTGSVD